MYESEIKYNGVAEFFNWLHIKKEIIMNKVKNEIMLITYADSLGENLTDLKEF